MFGHAKTKWHWAEAPRRLEIDPGRDLACPVAAKIRTAGGGNLAERRVIDGQNRIGQVYVVKQVRERGLDLQLHTLVDRESLAQRGIQVQVVGYFAR